MFKLLFILLMSTLLYTCNKVEGAESHKTLKENGGAMSIKISTEITDEIDELIDALLDAGLI